MKVYFLLFFGLTLTFNVVSQTLVDITSHGGSGYAYTITPTIVSTNYNGIGKGIGWSANLYLKSEMGPVNTLNSLRFMVDKDPSTAGKSHFISNCKIYLFHYGSNTQFISLARPDLVALNAVKVFEGDITINNPSSGVFCESQILFSTSFSYDGVSSLGVYFERTEPYAGNNISISPYWGFIDDADESKLRHLSDWYGTVSNPLAANSIVYPSVGRNRRYAQIKFNDVSSPTCAGSSVVPAVPTGASSQSFCSSSNPKISDLVVTGSNIKWYNASSGGTLYSSPSTTALVNNTIYYASQTVSGVESTLRKAITVSLITPSVSSSTSASQSFCSSTNPTVANLVASGSSGSVIKWYQTNSSTSALLSTVALTNGTKYYAAAVTTGSPECESSSRFEVTVSILNPSISPSTSASQSFCSSTNPTVANLVASGSSESVIKWYQTSSSTSALSSTDPLTNGSKYYAAAVTTGTPACESSSRFEVTVSISTSAIVPIGDSPQTFCTDANPKVSDLKTTSGSSLLWYDLSSGGNVIAPTVLLVNGNHYYATVSGCESPSRLDVQVFINTSPLAPTTVASQNFCAIENKIVSDLSSTGVSGAIMSWYDQATAGSVALLSTNLLATGTYYSTQTVGSCESSKTTAVTVTVNDPSAPTSPIVGTQTFCSIDTKTVADLSVTGSTIKWYDAPTLGTAYASTDKLKSLTYYATQTDGLCESDTRLEVTVTVNDPSAPTSPIVGTQSFCSINTKTIADLSVNEPTIIWYTSGSNTALNPSTLLNNGKYYATQKVGLCESDERLEVTVTVNDPSAPTSPIVGTQSFCSINTKTIADLSINEPTIIWYTSGSNTALDPSTLLNNGKYYATQKVGLCESDERLEVIVTVNDPAKPTTTNASQSFCSTDSKKVSDLSATGLLLTWYDAPTSGTAYSSSALLLSGTYYASQKVGTCESKNRLEVVVKISNPSNAPTGDFKQYFCLNLNPKVSDLDASGTTIKWYNSNSGGEEFASSDALTDKTHYFATQTKIDECESDSRFDVLVNLSNVSLSLDSQVKAHCGKSDGIITVIAKDGIGNYKYSWDNQENNSYILTNAGVGLFVANVIDSVGCKNTLSIEESCESTVPQIITADGNGKNDTWVLNLEAKANLKIFNRWGSIVFTASPYMDDWNGQNNEGVTLGKGSLPSGTYFYTIDKKDGEKPLSGFIELVR